MENKNIHSGHRKRVKERFVSEGNLDNFNDLDKLELLLFYSNPRADTKVIAHNIFSKYSNLKQALDAPLEELEKVDGVGENSAVLLKLIPQFAKAYADSEENIKPILTPKDAYDFIKPKFIGEKNERLLLICLGKTLKPVRCEFVSDGSPDSTFPNFRKIVSVLLNSDSTGAIIAHNHPGGISAPSRSDAEFTENLVKTLKPLGIRLNDHIILGADDYFSFAGSNKFRSIFE